MNFLYTSPLKTLSIAHEKYLYRTLNILFLAEGATS